MKFHIRVKPDPSSRHKWVAYVSVDFGDQGFTEEFGPTLTRAGSDRRARRFCRRYKRRHTPELSHFGYEYSPYAWVDKVR